jgi:hypothetical protein
MHCIRLRQSESAEQSPDKTPSEDILDNLQEEFERDVLKAVRCGRARRLP